MSLALYILQVCCSSPERFLKLGRGGTLESKPIKGTRARSPDLAVDAAIISELRGTYAAALPHLWLLGYPSCPHGHGCLSTLTRAECAKDKSENLMIVDLLRNDLGRVSVPGSIHVTEFMDVETHATVHQLVSTVRGQLEEVRGHIGRHAWHWEPSEVVWMTWPGPYIRVVENAHVVLHAGKRYCRLPRCCVSWRQHDGRA